MSFSRTHGATVFATLTFALAVAGALFGSACSDDSAPTLAEMRACTTDSDCVATVSACCECGTMLDSVIGINGAQLAAYRASIGCTEGMACDGCLGQSSMTELRVECVSGTCEAAAVECTDATSCAAGNGCVGTTAPRYCKLHCVDDDDCRPTEMCNGRCEAM